MARFVATKTASGGSSGGGAGVTLQQVCSAVCCVINDSIVGTALTNTLPKCGNPDGWELICNCNQWDSTWGTCILWEVDTERYRAFRWCIRGITHCGCCHQKFCMYLVNSSGNCQTNVGYRWYESGDSKPWPIGSCCCWQAQSGDCVCWCWCCCGSACAVPQAVTIEIGQSVSKANCMSGNNGQNGVCFDICYGLEQPWCDQSCCHYGSNRIKGAAWCHPLVWSKVQHNDRYFKYLKIINNYGWIPTHKASVGWQCWFTDKPQGYPCWSLYGIPCDRPTITGSNAKEFLGPS